jgi:1,4-alpha-glucan branching enzyme
MPFGAELQADGTVRYRLWAPHREIRVELEAGILAMGRLDDGWHELVTDRARAGSRYRFVLPDGLRVPDPASRAPVRWFVSKSSSQPMQLPQRDGATTCAPFAPELSATSIALSSNLPFRC